ncbi:uncharacterized protein AMSG_03279 [Thecamonas trahens ATCC 50062]|uniref:Uncharacterized protein n=1 Tax=Thecamonas trahens ATCC 50062 TaxID=461836 RepID=A0A0L0D3G6_THETB|nr:hypothetical protein AMSG_03279 [Thecamonas trahens ATCC 50062]KNC46849.1 hypothetical protein AMSG_03279 [Thecamonas trahens ATCC 50062]|eukprot:XP_013760122.1 hypothetical protein AMSG_03279 [Thecamonas trahens ATCC 50062]
MPPMLDKDLLRERIDAAVAANSSADTFMAEVERLQRLYRAQRRETSIFSQAQMDDMFSSLAALALRGLDALRRECGRLKQDVTDLAAEAASGVERCTTALQSMVLAAQDHQLESQTSAASLHAISDELMVVKTQRDHARQERDEYKRKLTKAQSDLRAVETHHSKAMDNVHASHATAMRATLEKLRKLNESRVEDTRSLTAQLESASTEKQALTARIAAIQRSADARVAQSMADAEASALAARDAELATVRASAAALADKVRALEAAAVSSPAIHRELVYARQSNASLRESQKDLAAKMLDTMSQLEAAELRIADLEAGIANARPLTYICSCCHHRNIRPQANASAL